MRRTSRRKGRSKKEDEDDMRFEVKLSLAEMIIVYSIAELENKDVAEVLREALSRGISALAESHKKRVFMVI